MEQPTYPKPGSPKYLAEPKFLILSQKKQPNQNGCFSFCVHLGKSISKPTKFLILLIVK